MAKFDFLKKIIGNIKLKFNFNINLFKEDCDSYEICDESSYDESSTETTFDEELDDCEVSYEDYSFDMDDD